MADFETAVADIWEMKASQKEMLVETISDRGELKAEREAVYKR
jgi:hypothetical protein